MQNKQNDTEYTRELGEQSFRAVAKIAFDAIISADSDGRIIFWNNAAEKIFGYSANEILGKPVYTIVPQRFKEAHIDSFSNVV